MIEKEIEELEKVIKTANTEKAKKEGAIESLTNSLKEKFDVTCIADADKLMGDKTIKRDTILAEIMEEIRQIKEALP